MKKTVLSLLAVAGMVLCGAEDQQRHERGSRQFNSNSGRSGRWAQGGRSGGFFGRMTSEAVIAQKFPAEFAEVEAMREKYEAALAALAKKAEVELPEAADSQWRKVRKHDPAAFDAVMQKMKEAPMEAMREMQELARRAGVEFRRPGGGNFRGVSERREPAAVNPVRSFNRPDMGALRRKYPDKMKEYDLLRNREPEKARNLLLEIIKLEQSAKK
ncbi:MAG: hypothetical protein J6S43_03365 [Lentisphaeria bacterium]|nr:hypothetical protein [Lentisphaeria bacterium]